MYENTYESFLSGITAPESKVEEPGYFASFFSLGRGAHPDSLAGEDQEAEQDLTIYLPETDGNYVSIVVPDDQANARLVPEQNDRLFQQKLRVPIQVIREALAKTTTAAPSPSSSTPLQPLPSDEPTTAAGERERYTLFTIQEEPGAFPFAAAHSFHV